MARLVLLLYSATRFYSRGFFAVHGRTACDSVGWEKKKKKRESRKKKGKKEEHIAEGKEERKKKTFSPTLAHTRA